MCSIGHPDRHGPITLGHQHGPRWWPRPQASAGSPVTIEATDINTSAFQLLQDPGSRPGPCHSPVPDISWDLGGQVPAIQVSLLFTTFNFPDSSLSHSTKHFSSPDFSPSYPVVSHHYGANHLVPGLLGSCLGHRGAWLNTACPSHEEWHVSALSPLLRPGLQIQAWLGQWLLLERGPHRPQS